ncbi:MAG: GDCCVxC domain-containing (seleno)protein [bacterium JZ-2024 1]
MSTSKGHCIPAIICYDDCALEVKTTAVLTCPICRTAQKVKMPTNACQYSYSCVRCGALLKAKPGECCVFCSWADTPCPSRQVGNGNQSRFTLGG